MTHPLVHAFFVGRAIAEVLGEQVEYAVTNAMSELGKFDAEQREHLRQTTEQIIQRAQQAEEAAMQGRATDAAPAHRSDDLQAVIDDLRAETAQLRTELQLYRNRV